MLPFEFIWRRFHVIGNSLETRQPGQFMEGIRYDAIKYEACLKWSVQDNGGATIHDPFLILDANFEPLLKHDGMPRLMHPKKANTEIDYTTVLHPNK